MLVECEKKYLLIDCIVKLISEFFRLGRSQGFSNNDTNATECLLTWTHTFMTKSCNLYCGLTQAKLILSQWKVCTESQLAETAKSTSLGINRLDDLPVF